MSEPDSSVDLLDLYRLCAAAGEAAMKWYKTDNIAVETKGDFSPVTAADLEANKVLIEGLPRLLPGVPIVSEEGASDSKEKIKIVMTADIYWLIDPLDGTRDFLAQTDDFTVNVALMVKGVPRVGCIVAPARSMAFVADTMVGAFQVKEGALSLPKLATRKIDPNHLIFLVSRSHLKGEDDLVKKNYPNAHIRRVGSALKYALIAAGLADVSIRVSPTSLWDTAAAHCILIAAGGALLRADGGSITYRTGRMLNPPFVALADPAFDSVVLKQMLSNG